MVREIGVVTARTGPRDANKSTSVAEGSVKWALAGQSRRKRGGHCVWGKKDEQQRGPTSHRSQGA
jgi:hypothetical protein